MMQQSDFFKTDSLCGCVSEWLELARAVDKDLFKKIEDINRKLGQRAEDGELITPEKNNIFRAMSFFNPAETKVIILGQDPYPTEGVADGLAFSFYGEKTPQSLKNIFKELERDPEIDFSWTGSNDLTPWARQGILLLNTVLTTRVGEANAHKAVGWQGFTDTIIEGIESLDIPLVYLLLGGQAQKKIKLLNNPLHKVVKTSHPSPLGVYRGFAGSGCFSEVNGLLVQSGRSEIDWSV